MDQASISSLNADRFLGEMLVCKRLILSIIYFKIYSHLKYLLICTYRFKLAC